MIFVFTNNRHVKSQLSLLLRELGFTPVFINSANSLIASYDRLENGSSLLLDLEVCDVESVINQIKQECPLLRIIGFARYDPYDSHGMMPQKPDSLDNFFLLPSHAERAKARIISALQMQKSKSAFNRGFGKRLSGGVLQRPATLISAARNTFGQTDNSEHLNCRYLVCKSSAMRNLIFEMRRWRSEIPLLVINANEGAEFELAARELNYQQNYDSEQLLFCGSFVDSFRNLERMEKAAASVRRKRICYVGRTDELSLESTEQLVRFIDFLKNLRNPHLSLVLAHETGSESYFRIGVESLIKPVLAQAASLTVPDLEARAEDIRMICLTLLSSLRVAHPFIRIRAFSDEAIQQLIDKRAELSFTQLCLILRNACGICHKEQVGADDLANFAHTEVAYNHLMESMADEAFFSSSLSVG